ncbi:hypothetical protein FRB96_008499 [Tulasnella sp. 330]|nr:hypothetical protein FRB96_008499 [Tulasnella sp. 330]
MANYSLTGPYKNQYIVLEILGYLTTIAENVGCTAMIIGRIWWVGRDSPNPTMRKKYKAIIMALAESGMLYTVTLLVWSVLSTVPEWIVIGDFFGYIYTMIASIAPLLILLLIVKSRRSTGGGAIGRGAKMIHKAKSGPLAGRPAPSQVHDIGAISTDIEFRPTQ